MTNFLIKRIILVTLYKSFLTFRDTNETFELEGDLLKLLTTLTSILIRLTHYSMDEKVLFDFKKKKKFDIKLDGEKKLSIKFLLSCLNPLLSWLLVSTAGRPPLRDQKWLKRDAFHLVLMKFKMD